VANCNYTLAGVDTFSSLLARFLETHPGYMSNDTLDNFIQKSVGRFLFSYGTGLSYKTKKISDNYSDRMIKSIKKFKKPDFMKNALIYLDSGGFQVSMGAINSKDIPRFIDLYYQFISDYHDEITYAFLLDIPPGPGTQSDGTFQSYEEIYKLNKLSYETASQLPKKVIEDQLIYIHHFRTPKIYDAWSRLLFDDNLGQGYNYYSTGGLVAYGSSDNIIPIILYCIPLSTIVRYCKQIGKKSFKFHVLGGANFIDVLYHQIFSKHIKEYHGIDCQITYDSSSVFKGAFSGRFICVFNEEDMLMKMSFKSKELHLRFDKTGTIEEKMYRVFNELSNDYGFKELSKEIDPIYHPENGTLNKQTYMYVMIYVLQLYKYIEQYTKEKCDELYELYKNDDESEFITVCSQVTKGLNQGKMTKKQKAKSSSIWNSLKLLENLDEDYNSYLVNKYMAAGDSGTLDEGGCLKF